MRATSPGSPASSPESRSDRSLSASGRRRLAAGLAALAATPIALLVACGDQARTARSDLNPDPRASTEGVLSRYPQPVETPETQTAVPTRGTTGGDESPVPIGPGTTESPRATPSAPGPQGSDQEE